MAHHAPVQEDPQELARAQDMWSSVMNVTKWSVVGIIVILLGLTAAFVTF
jgi:multisubunit Na+/H+ antiporter MnhG subunit